MESVSAGGYRKHPEVYSVTFHATQISSSAQCDASGQLRLPQTVTSISREFPDPETVYYPFRFRIGQCKVTRRNTIAFVPGVKSL